MPRYSISHKTTYNYSAPVIQSNHLLHLEPREINSQTILRHSILVEPAPAWKSERVDYFGNKISLISLERDHTKLSVSSLSEIDVESRAEPEMEKSCKWEELAARVYHKAPEITQYTCNSTFIRPNRELHAFARECFDDGMPVLEGARRLSSKIFEEFDFDSSATNVATPVTTVLKERRGVCQDFAHLAITAIRSLGLPVRYVSGYILSHPPEGQQKLAGSDATHAWIAIWSPEFGWTGFDPTNDCLTSGGEHIAIAYGRDFADVSPMSGILLGGGSHTVAVAVDVIANDQTISKGAKETSE